MKVKKAGKRVFGAVMSAAEKKGYGHGDTATARRVRSKAYPRDRRSGSVGAA